MQHAHVERSRQKVIGSRDRVDIAGQVQIEIFHGDYLAVSAAGRATLDTKGGALAGLANGGDHLVAQVSAQRLAEADRRGGLSLAERGWGNGGDIHVNSIRNILQSLQNL